MLYVFRLGHRLPRDERATTHVALVARAFGADGIIYGGQHDAGLESSVLRIVENWGGAFSVRYDKNFLSALKQHKKDGFVIVHLTMYGMPIMEVLHYESWVSKHKTRDSKLLIVVGSEQVPREVYEIADYNIAVTSQPHSEVAALAIFLDRLMEGTQLSREFEKKFNGKSSIRPSEKGKSLYLK